MKVKWAAKTLSATTAAFLIAMGKLAKKGRGRLRNYHSFIGTGLVIKDFDKLLDVNNGPSCPKDVVRRRRENVRTNSFHFQVWEDMIEKMENMEFHALDKDTNTIVKRRPPCQDGFVHTMKTIEKLWCTLRDDYGFTFLNLRQLNQDPLENLFGVIRQHGASCDNPTVGHFVAALKTSIITGLTAYKSRGGNTEADDGELMSDLRDLLKTTANDDEHDEEDIESEECDIDVVDLLLSDEGPGDNARNVIRSFFNDQDMGTAGNLSEEDIQNDLADLMKIQQLGPSHVAGYIARKITAKWECESCRQCLSAATLGDDHAFTKEKEYDPEKCDQFYGSTGFNQYVKAVENAVEKKLVDKDQLHLPHIRSKVKHIMMLEDTSWLCCPETNHYAEVSERISDMLSKMLLRTICKRKCEVFKDTEEEQKRAREAEKLKSQTVRRAESLAKKARIAEAKEKRKQAIAEIKRKRKEEKEEEAIALKEMKRLETLARREGLNLSATPPRRPTRAEIILARANNVWNISKM